MKVFIVADDHYREDHIKAAFEENVPQSWSETDRREYRLELVDLSYPAVKAALDLIRDQGHEVAAFIIDVVGERAEIPHQWTMPGRDVIAKIKNGQFHAPVVAFSTDKGRQGPVDAAMEQVCPDGYYGYREITEFLKRPSEFLARVRRWSGGPTGGAERVTLASTAELAGQVNVVGGDTLKELVWKTCVEPLAAYSATVEYLSPGYSGDLVFAVEVEHTSDGQLRPSLHVLKVSRSSQRLAQEVRNHAEVARLPQAGAYQAPLLQASGGQTVEAGGWFAIAYQRLPGRTLDGCTLHELIDPRLHLAIGTLLSRTLSGSLHDRQPQARSVQGFWDKHLSMTPELVSSVTNRLKSMERPISGSGVATVGELQDLETFVRGRVVAGKEVDHRAVRVPEHRIHGDLHPGNVIVTSGEGGLSAQLIDFANVEDRGYGLFDHARLESHLWISTLGKASGDDWSSAMLTSWVAKGRQCFAQMEYPSALCNLGLADEGQANSPDPAVLLIAATVRTAALKACAEFSWRSYRLALLRNFLGAIGYPELRDCKRMLSVGLAATLLISIAEDPAA